jgi:hypothetical protein
MIYVVERYLPGLSESDLLRKLSVLERGRNLSSLVRYLGSTIVLEDEACYCQFEALDRVAVAETNRRAGLPFDRIVPALSVQPERRSEMSASTTIPTTIQIRRSRLFGLMGLVAAAAAAVTGLVLAFGFGNDTSKAVSNGKTSASHSQPYSMQNAIMSLTPAQLAAGALDIGYQLPAAQHGPTVASVLASMSPETRRYTKAVMGLTFAQLAAGAAGHP